MKTTAAAAITATASTSTAMAADVPSVVEAIRTGDDRTRGEAWQGAASLGAAGVRPLSDLLVHEDFEVARSAKRAIWKIVRHAGRPGADAEARAVEQALIPLLAHFSAPVRREVLWMLSEVAGEDAAAPIARLLQDREVRDDARCALQRIPGQQATMMLQVALQTAPEEFRYNLAEALRKRGVKVEGYPSKKLQPGARP
ncbi:MAG: hypothetical protein KDM81_02225 [Verrucomicrobiae bacterium]|nr:hypothetical protein [Verrucomicrobiae bacterium]